LWDVEKGGWYMYIFLLVVGAGFILISVVLGELFEIEGVRFSFLSPTLIASALGVMGATGLFLTDLIPGLFVFFFSASAAIGTSFLIHYFIIKPLHKMENTSTHDKQDLIGTIAKVALSIPQNGYGKIRYTVNGSIVTSPAKTENGDGIKKDTEVSILYIKDNAYYVRAIGDLESEEKVKWTN